ncbi:hypothetical protein SAMN02745911_1223 [Aureimonas altamirensis DSM 21988]|uniref:Baseplate protein J-like domain-containing protein n=2 Tax=Aureimonas altamirensis TaxID=370622 RepID=A0A0P0YXV2_9HYPH|nr:hypothetical protein [Aureimonas altamirensis]BAT26078.1 hypothetical protein [Aureimonas altamirensis]SHI80490.1 hypothetical protein SAMN02745911_1223 [Aureimonas altamirensis DSM 21988]
MTTYGVTPTGFVIKPIAVILDEREQAMVGTFGPGLIQTPQSPMGQINGILSEIEAKLWELGEAVYQASDPDQAEGVTLENLARLRLIERVIGETDVTLRSAITNAGRANIRDADFYRAITNVDGVTYARIYANDDGVMDENGVTPHSVSVIALGGSDDEIATVARRYIVPGISSFGNTRVETEIDGFCRSIFIMRPVVVPLYLNVSIVKRHDRNGCPPPPNSAIAETLAMALSGATRPANGEDITVHLISTAISCVFPSVEVLSVAGGRIGHPASSAPFPIAFDEIAAVPLANIIVSAT